MLPLSALNQWADLPYLIIRNIYDYLDEADLVRASAVNSHWRRVFSETWVWKSRVFRLKQIPGPHQHPRQNVRKYIETFGHHLQVTRVLCPDSSLITNENLVEFLKTFFDALSSKDTPELSFLELTQLMFDTRFEASDTSCCSLTSHFCKFLQQKSGLTTLCLTYLFFSPPFGNVILESLRKSPSASTLKVLDLWNYHCEYAWKRELGDQLRALFSSCSSLSEVRLNYTFLSAIGVETLCQTLKGSLQWLVVYATSPVDSFLRPDQIICTRRWTLACQHCPNFKVAFHSRGKNINSTPFLVQGIPLVELTVGEKLQLHQPAELGVRASALLDLTSQLFSQSLEYVSLLTGTNTEITSEPSKASVVKFLVRCLNVKEVSFSRQLMTPQLLRDVLGTVAARRKLDRDLVKIV